MEFFRRSDVLPSNQHQGRYFSAQPNLTRGQGQNQFVQVTQPVMQNSNSNDEGVLNLDSVFVHAPNRRLQPTATATGPSTPQYHYQEGHLSRGMTGPDGHIKTRRGEEYYDPTYPTVGTPNLESGWGHQFPLPNEMKSRAAYSMQDQRAQMHNSGSQHFQPVPRELALPQTQSQFVNKPKEFINQLGASPEEMTANLPVFSRNTEFGGNLMRPRVAPPRNEPPSTLNAVSLSISSTATMNAMMTYHNDVIKNHSIPSAQVNATSPRDKALSTMSQSTEVGMNRGKSPRVWVFTDVVTHICADFGFVGPEIYFQTSVVKGEQPQVGDTVLIEAEAVDGMQIKWNGKKVQVIIKKIPSHSNFLNSNKPEARPLSPTKYFSDVLSLRSSTKTVQSGDQNALNSFNAQKPFRNPPPPPNISKESQRTQPSHSRSRRSRSRSVDRLRERRRHRDSEIFDKELKRKPLRSTNSQRYARSRSRSPDAHHRSHKYNSNTSHKRSDGRSTREVSPYRISGIAPKKLPSHTHRSSEQAAPSVRIAPLRFEPDSLMNSAQIHHESSGIPHEKRVPSPNPGVVVGCQEIENLARKSILKTPSDIFSKSVTKLPNPAYKGNVTQTITPRTIPVTPLPSQKAPGGNVKSVETSSNVSKPISIRLGFLETKRQRKEQATSEAIISESTKNKHKEKESVSHSNDLINEPTVVKIRTDDNQKEKDRNVGTSAKSSTTGNLNLQGERKNKGSQDQTTYELGDKKKPRSGASGSKSATNKLKPMKNSPTKSGGEKTLTKRDRNVTNSSRRDPITVNKNRKATRMDEQGEKERRRKAYHDRVKHIRTRAKEIQHHRSEIKGKRANSRDKSPYFKPAQLCPSPKVHMEPFVELEFPDEMKISEAEIAEREQELLRQEMRLDEEQRQLEAAMAQLEADKMYLPSASGGFPEAWPHAQNAEFERGNLTSSIGHYESAMYFRDDDPYSRPQSPFYRHNPTNFRPDLERHLDPFERTASSSHSPWRGRPDVNFREKSPELAYFRIDRRSPCRIAPPEISPEKNSSKQRGAQKRKINRKPRPEARGSDEFSSRRQTNEFIEPFPPSFDHELSLSERRRRADEELMNEELGEEERRILRGEIFQPNSFSDMPLIHGFPEQNLEVPFEMPDRFVFAPKQNLIYEPEGFHNNHKQRYPKCGVCGKKGHFDQECWHRPTMNY